MLKKNKCKVLISSILILLPILFGLLMWNELPDTMTTHWGADGNADGFSGKAFAVFGPPCILLVLHFVCLLLTTLDQKQNTQNPKALNLIFWIIPIISLFVNGIVYRAAFSKEIDVFFFLPVLFGIMFIFMGNYFPKIKQNRTLGIKISWTLQNEENWNRTHRFAGKLWVIGGFAVLFSIFMPLGVMIWVMVSVTLAMIVLPVIYSYRIYRGHQKEGIRYIASQRSEAEKIAIRVTAVIVPLIFIGIGILMFTGDIRVSFEDASFAIEATYWTDIEIPYSEIDTITYRTDLDVGSRTNGFGSVRLSMGIFQNEELGSYTLYAYTGAKEFIVLTSDGKTLVIGMLHTEDTQAIYEAISSRMRQ